MDDTKGVEYGWNQDMPMSLHDKIRADLKTSMRNKAAEVKSTMRLIMAEFPKLTVPLTLESGKKTTRLKKPEEISALSRVACKLQSIVRKRFTVIFSFE